MARRIILVLIALLMSAGAIFLALPFLKSSGKGAPTATGRPAPPPTMVLVARTPLLAGQFIRPDSLTWQAWPAGALPASYLVQGHIRPEDLNGAVVRMRMTEGQPVTLGSVIRPGDRGFLAAVLNPGDRALTVNVSAASGDAGFVFPGDRVDIILTMVVEPPTGPSRHVGETILRNIRVVGMDQSFNDARTDDKAPLPSPHTATFELTPKQVEQLAVAQNLGGLTMSLRSAAETETVAETAPPTKTWDTEVTQIAFPKPPPPKQPPKPWVVDVDHGGATVQQPVDGYTDTGRRILR